METMLKLRLIARLKAVSFKLTYKEKLDLWVGEVISVLEREQFSCENESYAVVVAGLHKAIGDIK